MAQRSCRSNDIERFRGYVILQADNVILSWTYLKSQGPIDRKHGHCKKDGSVLYKFLIKQYSRFCKYKTSAL